MGEVAVLELLNGKSGRMVALCEGEIEVADLVDVLDKKKELDPEALRLAKNLEVLVV